MGLELGSGAWFGAGSELGLGLQLGLELHVSLGFRSRLVLGLEAWLGLWLGWSSDRI